MYLLISELTEAQIISQEDQGIGQTQDIMLRQKDWRLQYCKVNWQQADSKIELIPSRLLTPQENGKIKLQLPLRSEIYRKDVQKAICDESFIAMSILKKYLLIAQNQPMGQIQDMVVDVASWKAKHLVVKPLRRPFPICVPISAHLCIETGHMAIRTDLSDDLILQSPQFNPKTFGQWEHEELLDFYGLTAFG